MVQTRLGPNTSAPLAGPPRSAAECALRKDDNKFRQLPCRTVISTGTCPYRERCVYLHDPRIMAKDARSKNRRKNKEDIVLDSLFWPAMSLGDVRGRVESTRQPHSVQEYNVPVPQYDCYKRHDQAVYSLWMHFVDHFAKAYPEDGATTTRLDALSSDSSDTRSGADDGDDMAFNLINKHTYEKRLSVFVNLSLGRSFKHFSCGGMKSGDPVNLRSLQLAPILVASSDCHHGNQIMRCGEWDRNVCTHITVGPHHGVSNHHHDNGRNDRHGSYGSYAPQLAQFNDVQPAQSAPSRSWYENVALCSFEDRHLDPFLTPPRREGQLRSYHHSDVSNAGAFFQRVVGDHFYESTKHLGRIYECDRFIDSEAVVPSPSSPPTVAYIARMSPLTTKILPPDTATALQTTHTSSGMAKASFTELTDPCQLDRRLGQTRRLRAQG